MRWRACCLRGQRHSNKEPGMTYCLLIVAVLILGVTTVVAQSDPLSQRKALMKDNGREFATLTKMARGEESFEPAKVSAAFAAWGETAHKLPSLFPEPPKAGEDTRALPKIWENKKDFDEKIAAFSKVVSGSKDNARTAEELKVAMAAIGKACGDCHEPYRRPASRR